MWWGIIGFEARGRKYYRKSWKGWEKNTKLKKRKIVLWKLLCEEERSIQEETRDAADAGGLYIYLALGF